MSQLTDRVGAAEEYVKKHVTATAVLLLAVVFAATLFFGVHSYNSKLAKANEAYAALQAKVSADDAEIKAHTQERASQTASIQVADNKTQQRDGVSTQLRYAVVSPARTDVQVQEDATQYLAATPAITQAGYVFHKQDVQAFVATKIEDDTLKQDKADLETKAATLTDMVSSAESDLATCETDKTDTQKVLLDYKKAAIKSKWRKTLDITEKVVLFGGGLYLGYKAAK